jgi:PKD repeat protein
MKKTLRILSLLTLLTFSIVSFANKVYVKGYVTFPTGAAVPNKTVKITILQYTPSTAQPCTRVVTTVTNANGYYYDSTSCDATITKVAISTEACGAIITKEVSVSPNGVAEANFQICAPLNCTPFFSVVHSITTGPLTIKTIDSSFAGPADSIIKRTWKWGDNTETDGNLKEPTHVYAQPGIYTICLRIKTANGCENIFCKNVQVGGNIAPECRPEFTWENPAGTKKIRVNATPTGVAPGDSVIARTWTWGDGTTTTGDINPIHEYANHGQYTICLKIKTAKGCEKSVCKTVFVAPVHCKAVFRQEPVSGPAVTPAQSYIKFFSADSYAIPGDEIVKRTWNWGDGTSLTGNIKDPIHGYTTQGVKTVCLYIETRNGCKDTLCKQITIPPPATSTACQARFEWRSERLKIKVNSMPSMAAPADSIVSRKWDFGDSTFSTDAIVEHTYAQPGNYNVCLTIKTRNNCESRKCYVIQVRNTVDTPNIKIVSIAPNPVTTTLNAVVFSRLNNVQAELAIFDVYGNKKWSQQVILPQGNSNYTAPTGFLQPGPYVFKVTAANGRQSKNFFKVN